MLANAMRSDFGRTLRAIRTDQTAALALGIDVPRYKLYAFLIGADVRVDRRQPAGIRLSVSLARYGQHEHNRFLIVTMLIIGGEGIARRSGHRRHSA